MSTESKHRIMMGGLLVVLIGLGGSYWMLSSDDAPAVTVADNDKDQHRRVRTDVDAKDAPRRRTRPSHEEQVKEGQRRDRPEPPRPTGIRKDRKQHTKKRVKKTIRAEAS